MNQTPTTDHPSQTSNDAQADHGPVHVHGPGCNHGHHHSDAAPYVRSAPKIGPNEPCPCGSGKKFKKCCR